MIGWLVLPACFAAAAPELSDADRQRLVDGTTDNTSALDRYEDGLYVLLTNAADWAGDDFGGEAGEKLAPEPDYAYLREHSEQMRGKVFLIDGWLKQTDRFPTNKNFGRDSLERTGELLGDGVAWGKQLTRWAVITDREDPDSTVIVLFHDPRGLMPEHEEDTRVRIAARYFKLWQTEDASGKPHTFMVFVGGAAEEVQASAASGGGMSMGTIVLAVVAAVGAFFILRIVLNRMNNGGRQRTSELLAARRRERELLEDEEEIDEDLPEDPIEALDVLSKRHGENVE